MHITDWDPRPLCKDSYQQHGLGMLFGLSNIIFEMRDSKIKRYWGLDEFVYLKTVLETQMLKNLLIFNWLFNLFII